MPATNSSANNSLNAIEPLPEPSKRVESLGNGNYVAYIPLPMPKEEDEEDEYYEDVSFYFTFTNQTAPSTFKLQ